jgi:hypothetical protein
MPAVPEAVSECMGRRACLPQVQVDVGMALGLHRSAEHLELTKHLIVADTCSMRLGLAWRGHGGVKDAFRPLTARPSHFRNREAAMLMAGEHP